MKTPIVYLVGAGPGDPGLITVKGRECIARADVVIDNNSTPNAMLAQLRSHWQRINA